MMITRTDAKIDRIHASWPGTSRKQAVRLAAAADEVVVHAGQRIGHRRFVHVVVDGPDAGLVVGAGDPPVVVTTTATVLVLTRDDARRLLPVEQVRRSTAVVDRLRPA